MNGKVNPLDKNVDKYLLCRTLIRDACLSRLEIKFRKNLKLLKRYEHFYNKWGVRVYYTLTIINLLTIIIESPSSFTINDKPIPFYVPLTVNIICQIYFYYRWLLIYSVFNKKAFRKHISGQMTIIILMLMTINIFTDACFNLIPQTGINYIRWLRALRPLLLLTFPENRRLRAAFENLKNTTIDIMPVLGLMTASILFMSTVCVTLLDHYNLKYPDGESYFHRFVDAFWDIYVLSSTANSPDVIIPAYEISKFYVIIYVAVCVVSNWLFVGILTASVYNSYRSHLGTFVTNSVAKRKAKLDQVYDLMVKSKKSNLGIDQNTFLELMLSADLNRSEDFLKVIFHILDKNRSGYLNKIEFARLSEYMQAKVSEIELNRSYFSKYLPKFKFYSKPSFNVIKKLLEHKCVKLFFSLMIIANGFTSVICRSNEHVQNILEWIFFIIFFTELVVRYLICGGVGFFQDIWNRFDIVLVFSAFFGQLTYDIFTTFGIQLPQGIFQIIFLFRLFRLLKLLSAIKSFRVVIGCIITILPSLSAYTCMLLIFYYILSCIGMELFGGMYSAPPNNTYITNTTCNNIQLLGTEFVKWHYCIFNFNSALDSFLLLLIITVGNNWHIFVDGFVRITNIWTKTFFIMVHWICCLLVLNVVLAFIIEAFLIEYDAQQSKFEMYMKERLNELGMDAETELKKKGIENFDERMFIITEELLDKIFPITEETSDLTIKQKAFFLKSDNASIEILMFRMFEKEIEELVNQRSINKAPSMYKAHDIYAIHN